MPSSLGDDASGPEGLGVSVRSRSSYTIPGTADDAPRVADNADAPTVAMPLAGEIGATPFSAMLPAAPGTSLPIAHEAPASPSLSDEVTFISGLNPDGTLALYSEASWNGDYPSTYDGGYTGAAKWFADTGAGTAGTSGGTVTFAFDPASNWTSSEQASFTAGLSLWSAVANISFSVTTDYDHAGIRFTRGSDGRAHTQLSGTNTQDAGLTGGTKLLQITQATISIDTSIPGFGITNYGAFVQFGGYSWMTLLHEEGHALGLSHGGPYPVDQPGIFPEAVQYSAYDSRLWSIMSYIDPSDPAAAHLNQYNPSQVYWGSVSIGVHQYVDNEPYTLMPLDILAVQRLYGTPTSTPLSGGQTFGNYASNLGALYNFFSFPSDRIPVLTIWDAGTGNTLNASYYSDNAVINLNPGTFSSVAGGTNNIAIAFDTRIDKLISGDGNDTIIGNDDGNTISSLAGNDTIMAGSGNDTINAGYGVNTINGGVGTDTASFLQKYGAYSISKSADGALSVSNGLEVDTLTGIEYLAFTDMTIAVSALDSASIIVGTTGDDILLATPRDDFIDGDLGRDTVSYVNATGSVTVDISLAGPQNTGASGIDTIVNMEALIGSGFSDTLKANSLGNVVNGLGADDVIYGGSGNDTLNGGTGTDTAIFSGSHPKTIDLFTGSASGVDIGNDTLISVENAVDTGSNATVTGNDADNVLTVGGGANTVNGGGGNDTVTDAGAGSKLDGGSGTYNLLVLLRPSSPAMSFSFPLGGTVALADGTVFTNFQLLQATTGAGDDNISFINPIALIPASRTDSWAAGAGNDTVTADMSNYAAALTMVAPGMINGHLAATIVTQDALTLLSLTDVENYRLTGGSGGDRFTGGDGSDSFYGGAGSDILRGGGGGDALAGGAGDDTLDGGSNVDTAVFSGARGGYSISQANSTFTISGPDGTDMLTGIEYAQFDDQTVRLLPGGGVTLDPGAAPATYMAAIRDFDGNNLTGQGTQVIDPGSGALVAGPAWDGVSGWSSAGSADVSGGGAASQILFNNLIGRWAEVTTQGDGQVYFGNSGWAGDTRIVGIYTDPEVTAGHAVQGGPDDSQRRFQNDLFIGNIRSVLGAGDYNHDGFQEVYFALTDGTAYLHALMWADGNIQYANYQSEQQVQDYLTANNVAPASWSSWLPAHAAPLEIAAANTGLVAMPGLASAGSLLAAAGG